MLKKEYEILSPFISRPWKKFTFKEIKKLTGKKSESYVYNRLKEFVKARMLIERKIGNNIEYAINLKQPKNRITAGFVAEYLGWSQKHIPYRDIEKIISLITTGFFIFIITGSYAKGTQTKKSDIDIIIICDDAADTRKIYAEIRHACEMNIPKIHEYTFTRSEFLGMLVNKEFNYGKEAARNCLLVLGGEQYFKIIHEAISNGFSGSDSD